MNNTSSPHRITPESRLALLMHENLTQGWGKMGSGLLRYSPAEITAVVDREHAGGDLPALTGIPRSAPIVATVEEAVRLGADTLVPGVAPPGGELPPDWWEEIKAGLAAGLSLVNGLHAPLANHPELAPLLRPGRFIWDVRKEPEILQTGSAAALTLAAKRVLTVGTDMAIGKMTASLELDRAARRKGLRSQFIASGQIGLCIAGVGVALDAVRVDFAAGAVEAEVMRYGPENEILFIEGQGSILNPASTAWLALVRGACPTHLILVHREGQTALGRFPQIPIPSLGDVARLYESVCAAAGAYPPAPVVGIALNTAHLSEAEARRTVSEAERETGLPTTDAVRFRADKLVEVLGIGY